MDLVKQLTKTIATLPMDCIMGIFEIIHPEAIEEAGDNDEMVLGMSLCCASDAVEGQRRAL